MNAKLSPLPIYLVIVGPTAVGKTDLSIRVAEYFSGEIISADSRLFYRGMDIGTAKPAKLEMRSVPHHMIDIADPEETWSLAKYHREVYRLMDSILRRGKLPILVGGTGQYIFSIIENWKIPEVSPDDAMREVLYRWAEDISPLGLHHRLQILDPEAAKIIEYQNVRRTVRALEVIFHSGKRFSELRGRGEDLYQPLIIGLSRDREELYQRIDTRIDEMIDRGFIAEVQQLLDHGASPDAPAFSAIGYRQVISHLQGNSSWDDTIKEIRKITRMFVRRQANWFKLTDKRIHWFDMESVTIDEIIRYIEESLIVLGKT